MNQKKISKDPQLHLGIPFFGRFEHRLFIVRVWLSRDIRYACPGLPFKSTNRESIEVLWFHSDKTSAHHFNQSQNSENVTLEQLAKKTTWWSNTSSDMTFETPSDTQLSQTGKITFPFQQLQFVNPEIRIELTQPNSSDVLGFHQCPQISAPTLPNDGINCDGLGTSLIHSPCLTPLFGLPNHFKLEPPFTSVFFFENATPTRLSILPITPTVESFTPRVNIQLITANIYPIPYLPSSLLAMSILRSWNLLDDVHSCPFIIIAIDLCDQSSIELTIWAYHTLLYLYNHAAPFPERHTKVLLMIFNSMSLDSHLVSLETVQRWFDIDGFPLSVEYYLHPDLFVLPPRTPKGTRRYNYNHHITNTSSSSPQELSQFQLQQVETIHKNLALYLDKLYTSQVGASCLSYITQEFTTVDLPFAFHQMKRLSPPPFPLPRFIPSNILLPLRSQTHFLPNGTSISIKPPHSMPHWCNFDTYDFNQQKSNSSASSPITSSNYTYTASPNDDYQHKTLELHQNQHFLNHICRQYDISVFSFLDYNSRMLPLGSNGPLHQDDPTPLTTLFSELSSMKFDLLCMPFSSILNPSSSLNQTHSCTTMQDMSEMTSKTTLSSIKAAQIFESDFTIHYVRQIPKCNTTEDSFAIDHFSTCPVRSVLQYNTSLPSSTPLPTQSTSLLTASTTTTIYQSEPRPERYYSMMNVDDATKEKLYLNSTLDAEAQPRQPQQQQQQQQQQKEEHQQQEKQIQQPDETTLSPFLSMLLNFPDQATDTITQLFASSTSHGHGKDHSEKPSFSLSQSQQISPLSSKLHHVHLKTDSQGTFFEPTYISLPIATLFACSLFPLSEVYRYVQIIEHIRRIHYTPSILDLVCLWKTGIHRQRDFKFTAHHFPNSSPFQLTPGQLEQTLQTTSSKSTKYITSFPQTSTSTTITTSSSTTVFQPTTSHSLHFNLKKEHFIYRCSTNVPTLTSASYELGYETYKEKSQDKSLFTSGPTFLNKSLFTSGPTFLSSSSSLYRFMDTIGSCGYQPTPHFLMIIDDYDECDPDLFSYQHDPQNSKNYTFGDKNRPAYLTKNAALVNSFLTFFTKKLEIPPNRHIATHYSFVSPSQAKHALLEFSKMALGMRMDYYNDF